MKPIVALALLATVGLVANAPAQVTARSASRCAPTHVRGTPFSIVIHRGRVLCGQAQKIIHTFQKGGGTEHGTGSQATRTVDGWSCFHGATATECFKGGVSYRNAREDIEAFIESGLRTAPIGSILTVYQSGDALQVTATVRDPVTAQDEYGTPKAGHRLVAVYLGFTNNSYGTISGDANFTKVIGSDGLIYKFDPAAWLGPSLGGCGNFELGEYSLLPESKETGCVVYDLPEGITVQAVQFGTYIFPEAQWNA